MCGSLVVVNQPCISHWTDMQVPIGGQFELTVCPAQFLRYEISFKDIRVTTLTFWGHVTSSVTWLLDSQYGVSYRWAIWADRLSRMVFEVLSFKDIGVTTLTFHGHVTSSVTWSLDSWYAVSYRWFFEAIALSRIIGEILCVKYLVKHIPIENALIPIFVLGAKLGVTALCNFVLVAAP